MSVISASNAAICWPPLSTPNSAAVLISFMLFGGPAAMPMILALEACACSTKDDRSGVASGGRTEPSTLPPLAVERAGTATSAAWGNGKAFEMKKQFVPPRVTTARAVPGPGERVAIDHHLKLGKQN